MVPARRVRHFLLQTCVVLLDLTLGCVGPVRREPGVGVEPPDVQSGAFERIPASVLVSAGLSPTYQWCGPHEIVEYTFDLTKVSDDRQLVTRGGELRVLSHPVQGRDFLPPKPGRCGLLVWGVPCMVGSGPCTVWRGRQLVNFNLSNSYWIVADMGRVEGPYLFAYSTGPNYEGILYVTIRAGASHGKAPAGQYVGSAWLGRLDLYRFAAAQGKDETPPDFVLARLTEGEWHDTDVRLRFDEQEGRYRLLGDSDDEWTFPSD